MGPSGSPPEHVTGAFYGSPTKTEDTLTGSTFSESIIELFPTVRQQDPLSAVSELDRMAAARRWLDNQTIPSPQQSPQSTRSSARIQSTGQSPITSLQSSAQSSPEQVSLGQHAISTPPRDQLLTTSSLYKFLLQTETGDLSANQQAVDLEPSSSSAASPGPSSAAASQAVSASLHGWLGASSRKAQPSLRATIAQAGWPGLARPNRASASSAGQDSPESSVQQRQSVVSARKPTKKYPAQLLSSTSSIQRLITDEPASAPQLEDLREVSFSKAISEPCTFDSAGEVPDSARRSSSGAPRSPRKLPDSDALVFTVLDGELVPDQPLKEHCPVSKFSVEAPAKQSSQTSLQQPTSQHQSLSKQQQPPHPCVASRDLEAQQHDQSDYCLPQGCEGGILACLHDRLKGLKGRGQSPPQRPHILQVSNLSPILTCICQSRPGTELSGIIFNRAIIANWNHSSLECAFDRSCYYIQPPLTNVLDALSLMHTVDIIKGQGVSNGLTPDNRRPRCRHAWLPP